LAFSVKTEKFLLLSFAENLHVICVVGSLHHFGSLIVVGWLTYKQKFTR
jgi:hypothetical protein